MQSHFGEILLVKFSHLNIILHFWKFCTNAEKVPYADFAHIQVGHSIRCAAQQKAAWF